MSADAIAPIVRAVLYEGYLLYPYRPSSIKNRDRWTIGGLMPRAWSEAQVGESATLRVECLVEGSPATTLDIEIGFLQQIETVRRPDRRLPEYGLQEAIERRIGLPRMTPGGLVEPREGTFRIPANRVPAIDGEAPGLSWRALDIDWRASCTALGSGLFRIGCTVTNTSALASSATRSEAMAAALASCHLVLRAGDGRFVSLLDPPPAWAAHASACRNEGVWPVLVGDDIARATLLASPIILYDYPQVAPESPGDLFDATEIDEILTLRILAMTDAEKREMAASDPRARALLERTERLTADDMQRLHGTLRMPRAADTAGHDAMLRVGARVRLRPRRNADIFDLALTGMMATIESIERDFEDRIHLAVTIDDDPGRDLGVARMPGHRFFFAPDEVEPAPGGSEERAS